MGFPTRIGRSALGPTKQNARQVRNPNKEVSAPEWNLARWSIAGMAGVVPQAWVFATFTGPDEIEVTAHREAWDPDGTGPAPEIERTGAGVYVITYEATYPDENGTEVAIQLFGGTVGPSSTSNLNGTAVVSSNRIVTVRIFTANSAAATDSSFLVAVW